ncbi:MAG TPA: STAS domain-containing protein [Balneolaceae bacterium]|nr:STAS domain-containing protein [Balneolaceae bacterium]
MKFNISERYNCVVIQFKGNVMGGPDAVRLNEKLHELIEKGQTNVIADVGKVRFMNSSGLGMLIGGLTTMRKAGGDMRIANPTDRIESLLVMTKLITVFKHFDSLDKAIESYQPEEEES